MIHWLVTDLSDVSRQRQEVSESQEPDHALVLNLTWITDSILRQNQWVYQPFHQLGSSEVGCHGLVVLALHCERMSVRYPCRAVRPLQGGGFAAARTQKQQLNNLPAANRKFFLQCVRINGRTSGIGERVRFYGQPLDSSTRLQTRTPDKKFSNELSSFENYI